MVIEMQIGGPAALLAIGHFDQRDHARQHGVPAHRRLVRGIRKPEGASLFKPPGLAHKPAALLVLALAIATDAVTAVAGQHGLQISPLSGQHLLKGQPIRLLGLQEVLQQRLAPSPNIGSIARIVVANVKRDQPDLHWVPFEVETRPVP